MLGDELENLRKILDASRGNRLDRSGGNRVNSNLAFAELASEIFHRCLKRRLGYAHYVVVRDYPRRAKIRQRHNRAAVRHQGHECFRNGHERKRAHFKRKLETRSRSIDEGIAEVFVVCRGEAVNDSVELVTLRL